MNIPLLLAKYYLLLLLLAALVYLAGHGLMRLAGLGMARRAPHSHARVFLAAMWGTVALTTVYALATTRLQSIQVFFPLLIGVYWWWEFRRKANNDLQTSALGQAPGPLALELWAVLTLAFGWQAYTLFDWEYGFPITPNSDVVFAARNIYLLNQTGIERTIYTDGPVAATGAPTPYHYFEYWFAALASRWSGQLPIYNLKINQIPFFVGLVYVGFMAVLGQMVRLRPYHRLLCLAALPLHFPFHDLHNAAAQTSIQGYWQFLLTNIVQNDPMLFKTLPLYAFTVLAVYFAMARNWHWLSCALLCIPIACTTAAPLVFPPLVLVNAYVCWRWWRGQKAAVGPGQAYFHLAACVGLAVCIAAFYVLAALGAPAASNLAQQDYSFAKIAASFGSVSYLFTAAGVLLRETAWLLVFCLPLLGLAALHRARIGQQFGGLHGPSIKALAALLLVLVVLTGLAAAVALSFNRYSFVFYRLMGIPVLYVGGLVLAAWAVARLRHYALRIVITALVVQQGLSLAVQTYTFEQGRKQTIARQYSATYLQAVAKVLGQGQHRGAYLKSANRADYPTAYTLTDYNQLLNPVFYYLGTYLCFVDQGITVSLLSPLTDLYDAEGRSIGTAREAAPFLHFYKYTGLGKQKWPLPKATAQQQVDFLRKEGITFLLASKRATVPPQVRALVRHEIADSVSGERFLLLK